MSKKLITACMALFALAAFVLPAAASASPELTQPTGTRVPVESGGVKTKITATNIGNIVFKNDAGTTTLTTCTSAKMTGEIVKNSGTLIEANITTATFSGDGGAFHGMNECTWTADNFTFTANGGNVDEENVANGTPWCLKTISATEFQVRGGLCSEETREITFIFDNTNIGECKYKRAAAIKGAYTTDATGDAILTVSPNANSTFVPDGTGNNILCPSQFTLEMSFTLEKDEVGTTPMYIS